MNIFKTFDMFLREPLSILKERIIQIVNVNSNLVTQASVNVDMLEKKTQITVVNSDKMYNLLNTVVNKRKHLAEKRSQQNLIGTAKKKQQVVLGQLFGRM